MPLVENEIYEAVFLGGKIRQLEIFQNILVWTFNGFTIHVCLFYIVHINVQDTCMVQKSNALQVHSVIHLIWLCKIFKLALQNLIAHCRSTTSFIYIYK